MELLDGVALGLHDPAHQIADGNEADDISFIDDGQVADAVAGHELHAGFDAVLALHGDRGTGDNFPDLGVTRGAALEDNLAAVIAL